MKGKTIVVWFSCGAASAVAAKLTLEKYGKDNTVRVVNNPIKEEHHDNQRFLRDVEDWLGIKIEIATNTKYPDCSIETVFDKHKFMGGIMGAPCTMELKKKARQQWEKENHHDYLVLGFTSEEQHRADRFRLTERENLLTPLIDERLSKVECFQIISEAGIDLPHIYKLGFPNANCIGCVKSASPTYWNHVRRHFPDVFNKRAEQADRIGAKLVKVGGERIPLSELDPTLHTGDLRGTLGECGLFCEEPTNSK